MKNVLLSVIVISALVAAGIGGTFAGFVDTEESQGNFVQAGITDLLVNGLNDPDLTAKFTLSHVTPCNSNDMFIDLMNWGVCDGGKVYLKFKDIVSEEAGYKEHGTGMYYVFDNAATGSGTLPDGVPDGYRIADLTLTPPEPAGAGVWSSEPEMISEVGGGRVGQIDILSTDENLLGEDYASGISDHLGITVEVPYKGKVAADDILGNPDTDGDGQVILAEYTAWSTNNRWVPITYADSGKLVDMAGVKKYLGFLKTQEITYIHVILHLQQIEAFETDPDTGLFVNDPPKDSPWPDVQTKWWPTNALQGDIATWGMLFELSTD